MNYLQKDAKRIREELPPEVPIPDDSNELFLVYAVLMRAKGDKVTASDVHDAWSAWMSNQDDAHLAIRPYSELEVEKQAEDEPFLIAIQKASQKTLQQEGETSSF
ncbi:MAG: hypothetical protein E7D71_09345 [Varibaculum cambriense]|nr:hypothetical protein [Varibaculum cambriense]